MLLDRMLTLSLLSIKLHLNLIFEFELIFVLELFVQIEFLPEFINQL